MEDKTRPDDTSAERGDTQATGGIVFYTPVLESSATIVIIALVATALSCAVLWSHWHWHWFSWIKP